MGVSLQTVQGLLQGIDQQEVTVLGQHHERRIDLVQRLFQRGAQLLAGLTVDNAGLASARLQVGHGARAVTLIGAAQQQDMGMAG
ncbi:hypothetical protein KU43P_15380 [Pseudomonas sp. KU43P]|nr:hypothetical protein KU43P_15380 [Pseudomonas sp. KU43P]